MALAYADALVVRTAGLYGSGGNESKGGNFVQRMVARAHAQGALEVVTDQRLTPTYTADLAEALIGAVDRGIGGLLHVTNSDACSWHEFTLAIMEIAGIGVPVKPIDTMRAPGGVDRPLNGVLSCARAAHAGLPPLRPWRSALEAYMSSEGLAAGPAGDRDASGVKQETHATARSSVMNSSTNGHQGNGKGSGPVALHKQARAHQRPCPHPPEKGKTVLITGGGGYVGCVLTGRLLDRGYNVRILDRLYWGEGPLESYAGRIELVFADVRDIPAEALDGIDGVIHLAGLSNDPTAEYDPEANWQMNAVATRALGEACVERGIERLVFASSCSLYDGLPPGMHDETAAVEPRGRVRHLQALRRAGPARADRRRPLPGHPAQRHRLRLQPADALRPRGQHVRQGRAAAGAAALHGGGWMWRPLVDVRDVADAMIAAPRGAERDRARARSSTSCTRTTRSASWRCSSPARCSCSGAACVWRRSRRPALTRDYECSNAKLTQRLGFTPCRSVVEAVSHMLTSIDLTTAHADRSRATTTSAGSS